MRTFSRRFCILDWSVSYFKFYPTVRCFFVVCSAYLSVAGLRYCTQTAAPWNCRCSSTGPPSVIPPGRIGCCTSSCARNLDVSSFSLCACRPRKINKPNKELNVLARNQTTQQICLHRQFIFQEKKKPALGRETNTGKPQNAVNINCPQLIYSHFVLVNVT